MKRFAIGLLSALLLAGCQDKQSTAPDDALSFIVIGDTPYSKGDERMLSEAVPLALQNPAPFVIHIGDYKGGRAACTQDHDDRFAALISRLSPKLVVYTPGDNEWTDCDRNSNPDTGKLYSDLDRLDVIRDRFFSPAPGPETGSGMTDFTRQDSQPENASWAYRNVRFVTLHVTGTNNGRDWVTGDDRLRALAAVTVREQANLVWLSKAFKAAAAENAGAVIIAAHADMTDVKSKPQGVRCTTNAASDDHPCDSFVELRTAILEQTEAFGKPVLLIHGDTAPFTLDREFSNEGTLNLWRLNAAGDHGPGYGVNDITEVTVQLDRDIPFAARGVVTGKTPK